MRKHIASGIRCKARIKVPEKDSFENYVKEFDKLNRLMPVKYYFGEKK